LSSAPIVNPHLDIESYDPSADMMVLNLGPQHPSTHGVFRVKLYLDGEVIVKAIPYAGYLHRGVEKLCEELTLVQVIPIVDKNDYVSPMMNEQAIAMTCEDILGVEVPRRALYIRTIFAELQRLASHLLWLGTFGMDLGGALGGGATLFMYCFRERETILSLFEEVTGCRFHYNTHAVGGNRHDITAKFSRDTVSTLDVIEKRIDEYIEIFSSNQIYRDRTVGVGVLDGELAISLGITGPLARASGIDHDLRRDAPYHLYGELDVNVPIETAGDCLARTSVRILEMRESIRIVREIIGSVPEGPIMGMKPGKSPSHVKLSPGQHYRCLESPRGELGTYLIGGGKNRGASAYRLKIRSPSLHAASCIPYIFPGHTVSDAIAILGTLDPIMGEVDR
jgi:NADH-quinone oxidoreductase subunit D